MEEQNTDIVENNENSEHRSTGPRTLAGKAVSSQNANKQGCCSKTLILRDEDPAEYEALHKNWWNQYQPADHAQEALIQELVDNRWFLMRAKRRAEQLDFSLPSDVLSWTADQQKLFNNFQPYKTAAERAFQKSFNLVETHLRNSRRNKMAAEKAVLTRARIEAQLKKLAPKPEPPPGKFTPLAEIEARMRGEYPPFTGVPSNRPNRQTDRSPRR